MDKLKTGLKHGKIVGKIGQINKAVIKYEDLKNAIYFAEKTGCKSKITQNLKAHASSILEIRQSLLACLWSVADKSNVPEAEDENGEEKLRDVPFLPSGEFKSRLECGFSDSDKFYFYDL